LRKAADDSGGSVEAVEAMQIAIKEAQEAALRAEELSALHATRVQFYLRKFQYSFKRSQALSSHQIYYMPFPKKDCSFGLSAPSTVFCESLSKACPARIALCDCTNHDSTVGLDASRQGSLRLLAI
jgi:hypothetical protein